MARILQIYDIAAPTARHQSEAISDQILQTSRILTQMGHEVTYLTATAPSAEPHEYDRAVRILRADLLTLNQRTWNPAKLTLRNQLAFQTSLWRKLRDLLDFDVYHGHLYNSDLTAQALATLNNKAAVNTIHGSYHPVWRATPTNRSP